MQYKVLYASRYNFPDKQTGQIVSGCKVQYVDSNRHNEPDAFGCPCLTIPADYKVWEDFKQLPGDYELDFACKPDSRGRPVMTLIKAQLVEKQ